jgi:hypothetical protein
MQFELRSKSQVVAWVHWQRVYGISLLLTLVQLLLLLLLLLLLCLCESIIPLMALQRSLRGS